MNYHRKLILSIIGVVLLTSIYGCQNTEQNGEKSSSDISTYKRGAMVTESGHRIEVILAIDEQQQTQGLSGTKRSQWKDHWGMLFVYPKDGPRRFWMPDTYFDLDIIFLDRNFKVIEIEKAVPHYIGRDNPSQIPTTRTIFARHILEIAADSPLSKIIKKGQKLNWSEGTFPY